MNLIYHAAVGTIASKGILGKIDKVVVLSSIFADLASVPLNIVMKIMKVLANRNDNLFKSLVDTIEHDSFATKVNEHMYRIFHSLLILIPVTLLAFIYYREIWYVIAIAYFSHIVIDIPSHRGVWATRIFYPFSDFHIDGKNWWNNKLIFVTMWALLFIVLLLVHR